VLLRSSKYLNNFIEQDHRRIKQRLRPMLGLKSFPTAAVAIGGIELAEKIKKRQFKSVHWAAARLLCQSSGKLRSLPSLGITSNC
jgi:transposase-like protein